MTTYAIAQVRVGDEIAIAGRLEAAGCAALVLTYSETTRKRRGYQRRSETVLKAAMPGYIFLPHTDLPDPDALRRIPGYYMMMRRVDGFWAMVTEAELDITRAVLEESEFDRRTGVCPFKIGDIVKMKSDDTAFSGLQASIVALEKGRARVKFSEYLAPVSVPWSQLRKV